MRFVALALLLAAVACKDKPADKTAAATGSGATTATGKTTHSAKGPPRLPSTKGPGVVPAGAFNAKVGYTKDEVSIDGTVVATIPGKVIPDEELQKVIRALEDKAGGDKPVGIELDAELPYHQIGKLLVGLKRAGFRDLALVVDRGTGMIPLELMESDEANAGGLRPVITVEAGQLKLWSATGEEGTKDKPKLTMPFGDGKPLTELTNALAEIVKRRWPIDQRKPEDRTIIIQFSPHGTASDLLHLLAAIRADGNVELFPAIFFAGGV